MIYTTGTMIEVGLCCRDLSSQCAVGQALIVTVSQTMSYFDRVKSYPVANVIAFIALHHVIQPHSFAIIKQSHILAGRMSTFLIICSEKSHVLRHLCCQASFSRSTLAAIAETLVVGSLNFPVFTLACRLQKNLTHILRLCPNVTTVAEALHLFSMRPYHPPDEPLSVPL